jgi:hypothetical protein
MKTILASIILIIALSLVIWRISSDDSPAQPKTEIDKSPRKQDSSSKANHSKLSGTTPNAVDDKSSALDPDKKAATKAATIEKIHEASTTYDAAYLPVIKPYLIDSDPEIRENAVNAMIVLGDASAGKMLREAAIQMKTAEDVKMMLEAAEFVELPPADLSKLIKKKPADGEAKPREPRDPRANMPRIERPVRPEQSAPNNANSEPQTPSN